MDIGNAKRKDRARPRSSISSRNAAGVHRDNAGRVRARYAGRMNERSSDRADFDAKFNQRLANIIEFFLTDERLVRKNDHWFSVEEVADALKLRPVALRYIAALELLVRTDKVEGRDGCMRARVRSSL